MSKIMFNKVELILLKTLLINKRSTAKRDCKVYFRENFIRQLRSSRGHF